MFAYFSAKLYQSYGKTTGLRDSIILYLDHLLLCMHVASEALFRNALPYKKESTVDVCQPFIYAMFVIDASIAFETKVW